MREYLVHMPTPVEVVPYDPSWPKLFDQLRGELESSLAGVSIVGIEHVGSTAVPGLPGKPVIDVDVVVERQAVCAAIRSLEATGYAYEGDLGIPDRHALRAPDRSPRRHVYVVVVGSLALRDHLAVRDALRTSPVRRAAYGSRKVDIARSSRDAVAYMHGKTDLIASVLSDAGLTDTEIETIRRQNAHRS